MAVAKRHKSFTKKDRKPSPPLSFELYGQDFNAYPDLQGSVVLEFAASMSGGDDEDSGSSSAALIVNFFEKALKPESLERFNKLIHDPETIVEAEELADIVGWLLENYTSRDLKVSSVQSDIS